MGELQTGENWRRTAAQVERAAEAKPAEGQVQGVVRIGVPWWGWHTGARGGSVG